MTSHGPRRFAYSPCRTAGAGQSRSQFPGNRILADRITALARPSRPKRNFLGAQRNIEEMTVFLLPFDHRFHDRHVRATGQPGIAAKGNYFASPLRWPVFRCPPRLPTLTKRRREFATPSKSELPAPTGSNGRFLSFTKVQLS